MSGHAHGTGFDERTYFDQGRTIREHGWRRGRQLLASRYLSNPKAWQLPSPIRYGWITLTALVNHRHAVQWASILLAPLALVWAVRPDWPIALATLALAASSPLLWQLGRRQLQDAPVAVLVLVALGFAIHGNPVGLALSFAALLSFKEAAGLFAPALLVAAPSLPNASAALAVGGTLWAAGAVAFLGRNALPILRRALTGHGVDYSRQFQSGLGHRLFVDLALVSPMALSLALASHDALAALAFWIVLPHALAPVRNVRHVLAADIVLRASAAAFVLTLPHPVPLLACLLVVDAAIGWRLRRTYDPVTSELTGALGMSPHSG